MRSRARGTAYSLAIPCSITQAQARRGRRYELVRRHRRRPGRGCLSLVHFADAVADSGTTGHRVVWQAGSGAAPVISGGEEVSGRTKANTSDDIWEAAQPSGVSIQHLWISWVLATLDSEAPTSSSAQRVQDTYSERDGVFSITGAQKCFPASGAGRVSTWCSTGPREVDRSWCSLPAGAGR